ncbi:PTS sugar transporter subunit IIA [Coralloluteibacterium thermophilus]|uniref:PTS sugar transporter subunit IIA n=1 Tax=Coralloluteibacterium thermophilum TaxID=2707049 RepID=A0ABV9NJA2_9GAMM
MAVGILLVTHEGIGRALLAVSERLLGRLPLRVEAVEIPFDADADSCLPGASGALRRVDEGDGVLILSDVYGATPSRVAAKVAQLGTPAQRISGLGLPMLLRTLNYPETGLEELARIAAAGARTGVIQNDA